MLMSVVGNIYVSSISGNIICNILCCNLLGDIASLYSNYKK